MVERLTAMRLRLLCLGIGLGLIGACQVPGPGAPVHHDGAASQRRPAATAGEHLVRTGETLYAIAFHHSLDYRDLARWNEVAPPYTIYPGQRLSLRPDQKRRVTAPATTRTTPASAGTRSSGSQTARGSAAGKPAATAPSQRASTSSQKAASPAPAKRPVTAAKLPKSAVVSNTRPSRWHWPAPGKVLRPFSGSNPGVDLAGRVGGRVLAAADGVVVYAGDAIRGYGQLVIVKHGDEYLTAMVTIEKFSFQREQKLKLASKLPK